MSRIHVIEPGAFTTVQDLGRPGWQRHGVTPGGALDARALRLANLLVGNAEGAAALEITLTGPTLRFDAEALVALTGAGFEAAVNGVAMPAWRPVRLAAGAVLACGAARSGCRNRCSSAPGSLNRVTPLAPERAVACGRHPATTETRWRPLAKPGCPSALSRR